MKLRLALASMLLASTPLLSPGVRAAPVPATGGWIEVHGQGCRVGGAQVPCATATDQVPYQAWDHIAGRAMLAGAAVNPNEVKADIDGTDLGGRVTASFVDVYTLNGPAGSTLSFSATLAVTGTRSSLANTAIGFGLPGRGTFIAGSMIHYHERGDPTIVDELLTLALDDIAVGSTFSFSTIVDLLVNSGETAFFGSTAALGFTLPDGYSVSSLHGFSGPGSARPPVAGVPVPGSLALFAGGLAAWGVVRRRGTTGDAWRRGAAPPA